jgi:hypothetical protein
LSTTNSPNQKKTRERITQIPNVHKESEYKVNTSPHKHAHRSVQKLETRALDIDLIVPEEHKEKQRKTVENVQKIHTYTHSIFLHRQPGKRKNIMYNEGENTKDERREKKEEKRKSSSNFS